MRICGNCNARMDDASSFCQNCGRASEPAAPFQNRGGPAPSQYPAGSYPASYPAPPYPASSYGAPNYPAPPHLQAAVGGARGFGQIFGLDPRIAFATLIVDLMLNTGAVLTLGLLAPFSILAGIVLGFVTYKAQMSWYGDDRDSAMIKALIVALLTAIPTPLPAFLYVPSGVLGLVHLVRRK